jgi:hypothetical protein
MSASVLVFFPRERQDVADTRPLGETVMSNNSPASTFKGLQPFQQGVLAAGALVFILSFFPWYGSKGITFEGQHIGGVTIDAWHSYSTLAILLILAATAVAAVAVFAKASVPSLPVGITWIVAALSVLGTLLELLRLLTLHHGDGVSIKFGGYLLALAMIGQAACAVIAALSSDEPAPWNSSGAAAPPPPPAA